MQHEPSIYLEFSDVSKHYDLIRKDIEAQRFEISKCANIIKPYQMAMDALNNSLDQLLKTKAILKERKIKLLNIISNNSDSEDEPNLQIPIIKGEMCENSTTLSMASFSFNSITNESNSSQMNTQFPTSNNVSHEMILNKQSTPIKEKNGNFVSSHSISEEIDMNKHKETSKNNISNNESSVLGNMSCVSVTDRKLKRKRASSISSTKKAKPGSEIPMVLLFQNRNLSHVVKVSSGILFSGDKGLLQLRCLKEFDVIRKYVGHESGMISHLIVANRNRKQIILSSCGIHLIVFDLKTGECLFKEKFGSDITYLNSITDTMYIGLKSGSFYSFGINNFNYQNVEKISNTFVQSALQIKMNGHLVNLMGCENGSVYLPKTNQSDPAPVIMNKRRNIYDLILLPGGSYIMSFSDRNIDLYNKNTLILKSSQTFEEEIRKIATNDKNLYVLFSKGSVRVYQIKKGQPIFSKYQKFETYDVTLKDIHVNDDNALLIGNENVYFWKF